MNDCGSNSRPIRVTPDSSLAEWVRWSQRSRVAPLAGLHIDGEPPAAFVADRVLVDPQEGVVGELVARYGAQIVPAVAIPAPPDGLSAREGSDVGGAPLPVVLRIADPPAPSTRAQDIVAAAAGGVPVAVSSEHAAGLLALVAELAADGLPVGLDFAGSFAGLPLATATDWAPTDSLAIPQFAGRARISAAWQLIEAYRRYRTTPTVSVGILDGGFWLNGRTPFVSAKQGASDFGAVVWQLNLRDEDVGAGGESLVPSTGGVRPTSVGRSCRRAAWAMTFVAAQTR